jgi:hypothetical protein
MGQEFYKAKRLRLLFRILACLIGFVAPAIMIIVKYGLFKEVTVMKVASLGTILLVMLLYRFRTRLMNWINSWEYSILKYILLGINKIAFFGLVWIIAMLVEKQIGDLSFCLGWIFICSCLTYLVLDPLIEKHDYYIKRELRKQETKEALSEFKGRI